MNTPSSITPSIYFDAPSIPSSSPDMSTVPKNNGEPDVKHAPEPAVAAPQYVHPAGAAPAVEKPTIDTTNTANGSTLTGQPTVASPDSSGIRTPERAATSHERAATAESTMTSASKAKISKNEVQDAKRISKVLKDEGRAGAQTMKNALSELERLQKVHKQATKDEASAISAHSKATKVEHKLNMSFLSARAKHEAAVADLKAKEDALNVMKNHVKSQADMLKDKEREIEEMRSKKALDDREREAKIRQLALSPASATVA